MQVEKYQDFVKLAKQHFGKEIKETQAKLDKSNTADYDLFLVGNLWLKIMDKAIEDNWPDQSQLVLDDASMSPMPESVHKQFMNMLVKTKNVNLLTDLDIYEDLPDIEAICTGSSPEKVEAELKAESDKKAPIIR